MSKAKKFFTGYTSNILLSVFAFVWLIVLVSLTQVRNFVLVREPNPIILYAEIALCAFAAVWATSRMIYKLRNERL